MDKTTGDQLISLEYPLLKVPYEQITKSLNKTHRSLEKEWVFLMNSLKTSLTTENAEETQAVLEQAIKRLKHLKKKLSESQKQQDLPLKRLQIRVKHLQEMSLMKSSDEEFLRWNRLRVDRILVDYLLREGYFRSAMKLAKEYDIEDFVDIQLFTTSKEIEDALRRGSCAECLHWCNDHKHRLRKMKSSLEFDLRLQEYIELVRANRLVEAIHYAKKHLMTWIDVQAKSIQHAMALLAFPSDTLCSPYQELYDQKRWDKLIEQYRQDNFLLHSLTTESSLSIYLQAGLSALKTHLCGLDVNTDCPVCSDPLKTLATVLPFSHHSVSCIVCSRDRELMNEDNFPLILPNGHVYCQNCIDTLAKEGHGLISCPRTNEQFPIDSAKKIFVT